MEYWGIGSWGSGEHRQLACAFSAQALPKRVRQQAAGASRLAACAPQRQSEHEHEQATGPLAGDERAESIPGFAPFGLALPKLRFEVSKIIGETFYPVQRL